ncbi:hypothetical protein [uncultured Thiodictyon sp.]|uniref:hypothetical protein n=1 Tax=uncultured Thiodictyon sp. TaxID=1846217 RepID=UPI0025E936F6|nr:hypothetical protein [uncultured Thiodictyon sp.]
MEEFEQEHQFAIDSADGKDLIAEYLRTGADDVLEHFFWVRAEWCGGYPLVHDRFVTYGAFGDLLDALEPEHRYRLLPKMLQLAEAVPDTHFHCALFLLAELIPDDRIGKRPANFSDVFLRLRLRAGKLGFLPNLRCTWDGLAQKQRYLVSPRDPLRIYTPRQLGLTSEWKTFFWIPLQDWTRSGMKDCRASTQDLREKIQHLGCLPGDRRLIYVTRIEKTWYWVWRLPGKTGTAHLARIVFLRQPAKGDLGLGHWDLYQQFHERDTPEAISTRLLEIEFRPHHLDFCERNSDG